MQPFRLSLIILAALAAFGWSAATAADAPKSIGSFGGWQVLEYREDGQQICYMVSAPDKKEGKYTTRGDVFAIVTHRPYNNQFNVFNVIAGYDYLPESKVTVAIGDESFTLYTTDDTAWADDVDDPRLIAAMKKGSGMVVRGTSARNNETVDSYSLKGFTKAYNTMSKACGVAGT